MGEEKASIEEIRERIESVTELSTLPESLRSIMDIILDDTSSAEDLGEEIAKDPVLSAKILRVVNSAFYGFYRKITAIEDAVVLMGLNEIRTIVMAVSTLDVFQAPGAHRSFRLRLWDHSLRVGLIAELLSEKTGKETHAAFMAGLLHDIGKVILDQSFAHEYKKIIAQTGGSVTGLRELELELIGVDHPQVGGWLAERWALPQALINSIVCHHSPGDSPTSYHLAALVHVSNALAHRWRMEELGLEYSPKVNTRACQEVGLSAGVAQEVRTRMTTRLDALQPAMMR